MCSGAVVVLLVRAQHTTQMLLAEDDHMIKALASDRADQSFGIAVLPWRSRRCRPVANAHRSDAARKCLSVDPVPITDEIVWRALPTACLRDLAGRSMRHAQWRRATGCASDRVGGPVTRTAAGMRSSEPRTDRSRRSHLHDSGGTFSSPAMVGACVGPCTWQPKSGRHRCRA